jgi:hypothetical protein
VEALSAASSASEEVPTTGLVPPEPSGQIAEPVSPEGQVTLSAPEFSLKANDVEPSTLVDEDSKLANEPAAEPQVEPELAGSGLPPSLSAPVPSIVARFISPPLVGEDVIDIPQTEAQLAKDELGSVSANLPPSIPLLGRIVPPPPVQLTPPPVRPFSPTGLSTPAPDLAPTETPTVRSEGAPDADPGAEPPVFRRNPAASPILPPPAFPAHPPPVLPSGVPSITHEAPHVDPPHSPILPVRLVSPPVLRPVVAPPPLFGVGLGEDEPVREPAPTIQTKKEADPEPPPPVPAPPPPQPLELAKARALLGLPELADLTAIGQKVSQLPGLHACLLSVRHETADTGEISKQIDPTAVRSLGMRVARSVEDVVEVGPVQHVTIFTRDGCISVFARGNAVICALHRTRAFLPGVCDTLAATADALSEA